LDEISKVAIRLLEIVGGVKEGQTQMVEPFVKILLKNEPEGAKQSVAISSELELAEGDGLYCQFGNAAIQVRVVLLVVGAGKQSLRVKQV
jgi:hypothetical protein